MFSRDLKLRICVVLLAVFSLSGCSLEDERKKENFVVQAPVKEFSKIQEPKIVIKKTDRVLEVLDRDEVVVSYTIGLGSTPKGDKKQEGDGKTPEGMYYVCTRNEKSKFYLSLGLSYPNEQDAKEALEEGLIDQGTYDQIASAITKGQQPPWNTAMGGEIMIHGKGSNRDWTAGCIAVEDQVMDKLWEIAAIGTSVEILP